MSKVLRFPNSNGKRRIVRRVVRRTPAARTLALKRAVRQARTRVLQQPIVRCRTERPRNLEDRRKLMRIAA